MVNNPFRGKPITKAEKSIQEWGKVKFKPTKFGNGSKTQDGKGYKNNNRKFDKRSGNSNKNKDMFNQVARDAKPENATPWNKYKDEIVFKQREEEQAALQANMDSEEAKHVLKQREMNYRKLLIEQKKQEPTKWENFTDEEDADTTKRKETNKSNSLTKTKNVKSNPRNFSNSEVKELISEELLNNFDSKKLSFEQNDKMRKIITKTTTLANGCSLKMAIKDMKRKISKKNKKA